MYIDLHIHSSASDGTDSPKEILEKVIQKDIEYFSICDHDVIDGSKKMVELSKSSDFNKKINFIPGIELTTQFQDKEYHILFYSYDIDNKIIRELNSFVLNRRIEEGEKFIKSLEKEFKAVSLNEFREYTNNEKRGGFKTINYLIDKNIVTWDEFFNKEWRDRWDNRVFKPIHEVINELKKIRGTIILAHPSYYFRDSVMPREILDELRKIGIIGIECYSSYCKEEYFKYYVEYCNKNNLIITAGSDYHGSFTKGRVIGLPKVEIELIRNSIEKMFMLKVKT